MSTCHQEKENELMNPMDHLESYSMYIDNNSNQQNHLQSRTPESWVPDDTVKNCFHCKKHFGYGIAGPRNKHHCRLCGRIFCGSCSDKTRSIPTYISKLPIPSKKHQGESRVLPVRVCDGCAKKLDSLQVMEMNTPTYDLFELQKQAKEFETLSSQYAQFQLAQFRQIQYAFPNHKWTEWERQMLWENRHYFVGHSKWIIQLIKSVDYCLIQEAELKELVSLLAETIRSNKATRVSCWQLMCTRTCHCGFLADDAIEILNQQVRCNEIRKLALSILDGCQVGELRCYIPYLVRHSLYAPVVFEWLLEKCKSKDDDNGQQQNKEKDGDIIASDLYWEMQIYLSPDPKNFHHIPLVSPSSSLDVIQEALTQWKRKVSQQIRDDIFTSVRLLSIVRQTYYTNGPTEMVTILPSMTVGQEYCMPTDVSQGKFSLASVQVKQSFTCPILLNFTQVSQQARATISLLWKPEDIRKDQLVISIIQLAKIILLREQQLDLPVVVYNVRPCSGADGFIEIVQDCGSLGSIRYEQKCDILTWLIDRNENTTVPAGELRDRFVRSCASYCVLSYLLGVGDRHLDNIMIRYDGALFHIDYGYVLGQDPKPFQKPQMRITSEMLTAMGGLESETYHRFQSLCSTIYNCLRRHINLFVCMLRLLSEASTPIDGGQFNDTVLMEELLRRFVPGENDQEAEIQLINQIERSTTLTYPYAWIDYIHQKAKGTRPISSLPRSVASGAINTASLLVSALWSITGVDETHKDNVDKGEPQ